MTQPILTTDRVTLRPHRMEDFDAYAAFFASDRAEHMGQLKRRHAWYAFCSDVAQWTLRGHGAWAIATDDCDFAGQVAVLQPDEFPEPELGWFLFDRFEGRGLAQEAAHRVRDWAFLEGNMPTLVSYIAPDNARSIALAERLGARLDDAAKRDDPDDLVYRHPRPDTEWTQ